MKRIWSADKVNLLIKLYRERDNLWDRTNTNYRIRCIREQSLSEIAAQLGLSIDEIERKIHDLRCQYRNERSREICGDSGILRNGPYRSKWEFYESLHFLYKDKVNNGTLYIVDSGMLTVPKDVSYEVEPVLQAMEPAVHPVEPVVHSIKRIFQPMDEDMRTMDSVNYSKNAVLFPMESVVHPEEHAVHSMDEVIDSKPVFELIESVVHPEEEVVHPKEEIVYPEEQVVHRRRTVLQPTESCVFPVCEQTPNKRKERKIKEDSAERKCIKTSENYQDEHQLFADYVASELRRYPERFSNLLKIRLQEAMLKTQIEFTNATYNSSEEMVITIE